MIYPYLFGERGSDQVPMPSLWKWEAFDATMHHLGFWGRRNGFHWGYALHALMPYLGSIVNFLLEIHYRVSIYNISTRHSQKPQVHYLPQVIETFVKRLLLPFHRRTYGSGPWAGIRNILVAPLVEEVIFRACTITPYLHTIAYTSGQVSMTTVCWMTPLFFGLAHVHHAFQMMRSQENPKRILIQTAFQLLYTTLFGAYASLWYIQTRSIGVVILLHSFCNYMGLPTMSFTGGDGTEIPVDLRQLYDMYRRIVLLSLVVGGLGFGLGFTRFWNPFEGL
jgi:prenyl protein peptidase